MGNNLKTIMQARRLTGLRLGELAGVSGTTITRIANGEVEPGLRTAQQIAMALGLSVNEVFPYVAAGPRPTPADPDAA